MSGRVAGDGLLDAVATALRRRVGEQRLARERLAAFVFADDGPARSEGSADGRSAPDGPPIAVEPATDWAGHLARVLRVAADPAAFELLESLRPGSRPVAHVGAPGRGRDDPLATAAWIGDLAAAGLLSHELATDRIDLTALGGAVLDLLDEVAARAAGGDAAGGPPVPGERAGAGR